MSKMKLWRLEYTLHSRVGDTTERWQDFWRSTTPVGASLAQHRWDKIFPDNYTVSHAICEEYTGELPEEGCLPAILWPTYKRDWQEGRYYAVETQHWQDGWGPRPELEDCQ